MNKNKGITLIALILIVVAIGIVIFTGWKYLKEYVANEEVEDIKTTMLSIQRVITSIHNKNIMDGEKNLLVGTKLDLENNETKYQISEGLKQALLSAEGSELYILNQEDLKQNGIKNITINETEFYVVDYNSEEVYYSLGVNGKYKLSEL